MKRMFSCSSSQVTMESWTRQDQKLLEAVTRGDVARVAALAARKAARPAKLNARGQSALHLAAAGGLTECLTLLLEHGAPVNESNDDGSTALHLATIACQPQCVKVLLQHGANERHVDGQNRTPLHWAASSGCASSVLLLCDHEAPLDVPDAHGQTPLMLAAQGNHVAVCAQLLRRGAEPGLADRDGRTALELALAHGSLEVAELLQGHKRDKDTGNVTRNVTGEAPSWALQKVPRRENGAGQVGIQGEEEEEEEEQRDGRAARRLREELARKTLECRRLEEAAEGIRRRLRELVRLLPGRDAGEDEEDEEDDGACLELLARRVAELRKRTRDEEWEGGHGSAEAPALIPFLAWLGEECSKMREAKAGALSRGRELRGEAERSLRAEPAWEQLAAGLEQALEQQDQIHARMLQGSQILLEKLRRCSVNGTEPAPGGKHREEIPREGGRMEKELLELREGNGKLLVELARLGRERERLQQELRELRDPGKRDEAWRLRRELRELRDGLGARVREAGGDAGAGILRDLHRRLDALVRSQHEALQLITEMEGEAGETPGSDGEGGIPGEPGAAQGPESGTAGVPPGSEVERWREAAAAAEEQAAGRERELRELRETAEGLERSLAVLRERAARLERACRDKDGKLKQLLVETEKLSAEVLGLRGRSARLQLQLEVQQKQHRDTVAVYRSHLLQAAQGFMDEGVHAALLRILRAEAAAGPWH
ncbi:ankyrin repeat domain-containing protein 35 [Haemorhous mexicanus]|uniref:ankyrin repeat domain-containing protein 35 n=1 Tax=Haemorhous mexicanus TaxID=30427 RepID=UPI0028BD5369|nr:ankyrin repeat domain-containing protein 35 [Haemorhous mexicanus]